MLLTWAWCFVALPVDGDCRLQFPEHSVSSLLVVVYHQHVTHRHRDNKQQDVPGRRSELGLHPDNPGAVEDRTDGETC